MDYYKGKLGCGNCYHFFYVNIGGKVLPWCFHKSYSGLIESLKFANDCPEYNRVNNIFNTIEPDEMTKTRKNQRNNKIKRRVEVYRYHYKIINKVAYIISRYSYWVVILSDDKEHLYHQNMIKLSDYEQMYLLEKPEFHLQIKLPNSPMAIKEIFDIIDSHDRYVLEERFNAASRSKNFIPTDFGTPHNGI